MDTANPNVTPDSAIDHIPLMLCVSDTPQHFGYAVVTDNPVVGEFRIGSIDLHDLVGDALRASNPEREAMVLDIKRRETIQGRKPSTRTDVLLVTVLVHAEAAAA